MHFLFVYIVCVYCIVIKNKKPFELYYIYLKKITEKCKVLSTAKWIIIESSCNFVKMYVLQ